MTRYELLIGDPWNFEGPDGPNRLILDFDRIIPGPEASNWILLKVVTPFLYNNELVELMVAYPRHRGDTVHEIAKQGGNVGVARIRPNVSIVRDRPLMPSDIDDFLIGSLTPLRESKLNN